MMQGMQGQQPPAQVPVPQAATGPDFRAFFRMDPPEFVGGLDSLLAHDWLAGMERVFQAIQCTEEEKIPKDWQHFKVAFLEKYFPNSVRTQKEREFQNFKQGDMSVSEYAEKFEDLADYSRQAVYAPDELWKIDHLKRVQEERNQNRTNFREQGRSAQNLRPRNPPPKMKQSHGDRFPRPPFCDKCRKKHTGNCEAYPGRCFECGEQGHMMRNCPKKRAPEKTAGRVYTLDSRKAKGNNNLIAATPLSNPMIISSATDDTVEARLICKDCSVSFNGRDFPIDLICLPLKKLDVILGMDWLSLNSVYIGCKEKAIFIPAEETSSDDAIAKLIEGYHLSSSGKRSGILDRSCSWDSPSFHHSL
ncbi:uncharacterized protein LOC131650075 [Vicia villosa]|uniref:uncharacterized protein LOC131650075 n=1 Tax=Vicia villosa TaxID=3911 RepID=UPI00273C67E3|nr:uncharacterized protein LOC131650075 [Vicia villosa]